MDFSQDSDTTTASQYYMLIPLILSCLAFTRDVCGKKSLQVEIQEELSDNLASAEVSISSLGTTWRAG